MIRQYRRWSEAAVWNVMLAAVTDSEASDNTMQMIDSTIVWAYQHAAEGREDASQQYWPFARWLYDQGPHPDECARAYNRLLPDARAGIRHDDLPAERGAGVSSYPGLGMWFLESSSAS